MEYLENRSFNITLTSKGRKKSREPFIFKGSRDLLIIQTQSFPVVFPSDHTLRDSHDLLH